MNDSVPSPILVPEESAGERLDIFLVRHFPDLSRSQIAKGIADGGASVSGKLRKASYRLTPGELVQFSGYVRPPDGPRPEKAELNILFEDDHIVIVNKRAGMVVHPAKGHWEGTLAGALAGRYESLSDVGGAERPGIVHRLDRDTSGVMIVARTNQAHVELSRQFADREVKKEYFAVTRGEPSYDRDWIDQPIAPHPKHRERMSISETHPERREARTFYEVVSRYAGFCRLRLEPYTGRTHQIRVHLAHLGTPVLCDPLYGDVRPLNESEILYDRQETASPVAIARLALHAAKLQLRHPITRAELVFEAELPPELSLLCQLLEQRKALRRPTR